MNKTLEQFVLDTEFKDLSKKEMEIVKNTMFSNIYSFEKVIKLLKQVREATIKECANAACTKTESMYTGGLNGNGFIYEDEIVIDKNSILDLDLNTIIL